MTEQPDKYDALVNDVAKKAGVYIRLDLRVALSDALRAAVKEAGVKYAERIKKLESLLIQALPKKMGGYPDLFQPKQGWDDWEFECEMLLKKEPSHGGGRR